MAKRKWTKRQAMVLKVLPRKLRIVQHESVQKPLVNTCKSFYATISVYFTLYKGVHIHHLYLVD
jgi:hypothetical protein